MEPELTDQMKAIVDIVETNEVPRADQDNYVETDVFAWSNNIVQYIDELKYTLYFFNRNMTPYRVSLPKDVARQLRPLFMDDILEYVLGGIEKGLTVRGFEEAEKEDGVLQRTLVSNVNKLTNLLNWIKHEQHNIDTFKESEHDLKRMKGVIISCSHPELPNSFYVIKSLPSSQTMKGVMAWYIKDDIVKPFDDMTALKIPPENQLLVLDQDLYVFSQSKLKSLFSYDAKAASIAEKKAREIESNFKLSFLENVTLQMLVKDSPATIRKLQKIDTAAVTQKDLVSHAEDMEIDMMTDDSGSILIVDTKDLVNFVNLLNDDYIESPLTGQRYEILKKRPLKAPKDEDQQV